MKLTLVIIIRYINMRHQYICFFWDSLNIITFLTDFGLKGGYVAQMKGVALSITDARLIDITHDITPHNVREGAFILRTTVPYFPVGTIHVAVVDPGVGTDRKGIIITTKTQILIGPDNGLLLPAARVLGDFTVYEIINKNYILGRVSNTFHGRDIFASVAAHIAKGIPFDKIGKQSTNFVELDLGQGKITNKTAVGKINYIDRFGNLITNINGIKLLEFLNFNEKITVLTRDKKREALFVQSYGFVNKGELLVTVGSSNLLEISINQGNAAQELGINLDEEVKLIYI